MMEPRSDRPDSSLCRLDAIDAGVDLPIVARLFTDPAVRQFLGGPVAAGVGLQRAREVVSQAERAWAVRPCAGDIQARLLGIVLLDRHHDSDDLEVSFLLLPEHWGRGYGRCAVHQALTYAFETLRLSRVLAETQSRNAASVRLLEQLGFGLLRHLTRFGAEQRIYVVDALSFAEAARRT
jgi:ribosomal-protein-alanine N-acetyltransferase